MMGLSIKNKSRSGGNLNGSKGDGIAAMNIQPDGPDDKGEVFTLQRHIRGARSLLPMARLLLLAILDHDRYGKSQRGCVASMETLANEIGTTKKHVCELLSSLTGENGWLVAEKRQGNNRPLRIGPRCTEVIATSNPQVVTHRVTKLSPTGVSSSHLQVTVRENEERTKNRDNQSRRKHPKTEKQIEMEALERRRLEFKARRELYGAAELPDEEPRREPSIAGRIA